MDGLEQVAVDGVVAAGGGVFRLGEVFERAVGDDGVELPVPLGPEVLVVLEPDVQPGGGVPLHLLRRHGDAPPLRPARLRRRQDAAVPAADVEQTVGRVERSARSSSTSACRAWACS